ncbi:hypothetical protein J6590_095601 [Homalodisca vitripennis]|nr:hypothetical protein J6590_095601 [Homalodisca vitripennis]
MKSTSSNNSITTVSTTKLRDYNQASRSRIHTDRNTLPYNHPRSTSKLRDYTQASRSISHTDRKTLPYNHPLSTTKLRDYT